MWIYYRTNRYHCKYCTAGGEWTYSNGWEYRPYCAGIPEWITTIIDGYANLYITCKYSSYDRTFLTWELIIEYSDRTFKYHQYNVPPHIDNNHIREIRAIHMDILEVPDVDT